MPRKAKLTSDESDRKDQRERTEKLHMTLESADKLSETAPQHLTGKAKKMWETIVPFLNESGYVINADSSAVETLAMNYQMLREAYESVKTVGILYKAGEKYFKKPSCRYY